VVAIEKQYLSDVKVILSHRYDNGGDLWTTPDKRLEAPHKPDFATCMRELKNKFGFKWFLMVD